MGESEADGIYTGSTEAVKLSLVHGDIEKTSNMRVIHLDTSKYLISHSSARLFTDVQAAGTFVPSFNAMRA